MKVAVIGLDGACMDLIEKWAFEGKLPTFAELIENGCSGRLESTIPTFTIPAWNCMTTGMNPGKIGCFSFIQKAPKSYEFKVYTSLVEKEIDIWDILNIYNKRIFLFNPPHVLTAYKINGYMISGFLNVDESKYTYPAYLKDKMSKVGFERDIPDLRELGSLSDKEFSEKHMEITKKQVKTVNTLINDENWDFIFLVLNELDRIQHRFWHKRKMVLKHYKNIDKAVKKIIKNLDEYNIFIVSDHGFKDNKKIFHINEWFIRNGLLAVEKKNKNLIAKLISLLKKPYIVRFVRPVMRTAILRRIYMNALVQTGRIPVIWNKTKAFSYGSFGQIYINLKGREPEGVVEEHEYEKLREWITNELNKMGMRVYKREEIYKGKYTKFAPDLVVQTDGDISVVSGRIGFDIFVEGFGGAHDRLSGTFIACGPDIKENETINNAQIYDITPTILQMFQIPLPKNVDGKILNILKEPKTVKFTNYEPLLIKNKLKRLKKI